MSLYVSASEYETEFLKVSMHTSQHIHQMRERHEMRVQVFPGKGMTCSFALLLTFSVPLRSISFLYLATFSSHNPSGQGLEYAFAENFETYVTLRYGHVHSNAILDVYIQSKYKCFTS